MKNYTIKDPGNKEYIHNYRTDDGGSIPVSARQLRFVRDMTDNQLINALNNAFSPNPILAAVAKKEREHIIFDKVQRVWCNILDEDILVYPCIKTVVEALVS